MYRNLHSNVWLLTLAQSFIGAVGPLVVFVGSFVGLSLAPDESLATLPVACMIVGIALFTLPVVKLFSHIGRRRGFLLVIGFGALNALFAAYAIYTQHFWLFCLSIILFGISLAGSQQFRFAAMESVAEDNAGQAVSVLLLAGLVAAFIGPEIGFWGKSLLGVDYAGSFVLLAVSFTVACGVLWAYQPITKEQHQEIGNVRPLSEIVQQPIFIASLISAAVGFAVMSFIMTATPISMHVHHDYTVQDTKWIIQSHVVAMYLPSLFTGALIKRFGSLALLYAGIGVYLVCLIIGYIDYAYIHYWGALVLLGIGWNFMFVTATSILPQSYTPSEKFKVQGMNDFVIFSSQAIASLSAGVVIHQWGWKTLLLLNVPFLIMAVLAILYWRNSAEKVADEK